VVNSKESGKRLKKKIFSRIILTLLLTSLSTSAFNIQPVKSTGEIIIRADGAVDPPTAPILRNGEVYTFTDNIFNEIVVERSNIIVDGNGYMLQGSGSKSGFVLVGINNVTIQNMNIQKFATGVTLDKSSYNNVSGNSIADNNDGVYLDGASNNVISGNNIKNNRLKGIGVYSSSEGNSIFGNNFTDNFRNMYISCSSGNTISENTITDSDYDGICLYWASDNIISENTITDCNYDGICLYWASDNIISENIMTENYHSVSLYSSSDNTISRNNIRNSVYGVNIYSFSQFNTISENTVTDNDDGIHFYSASNNTVSRNNITNNNRGIDFDSSSENTVSGNIITSNDHGIYLSGSYGNTISENEITDSNYDGVYLYDSSEFNTISENTITNNDYDGVYLYWSNNNTISENTITNNDYDGVYLYWSNNNTISENTITNNFRGIFFWSSSGNIISGNTNTNNYDGMCIHGADVVIFNNTLTNNVIGIALHSFGSIITGNNIKTNSDCGISVYDSLNNTIFHNNLINNTNQIRLSQSNNTWDDGYPSGGNYWSNYNGTDSNNDGIGDISYIFDENNQDNYPLMEPIYAFDAGTWEGTRYFVDVVSNSTVSDFYFNPLEGPFLGFSVTALDDKTGFCRVTVPTGLLWTDDAWTVKVNNQTITPDIMEAGGNTYFYFTYSHSAKIIEIRGTESIPEFGIWIPMLFALIVLGVALVLYKQGLFKRPI